MKSGKKKAFAILSVFACAVAHGLAREKAFPSMNDARVVPVMAELFTSQGCSSCPPADELLSQLLAEQPIEGVEVIALSEHVDYWNRLGWRDPFSSPRFSRRQHEYARAWNTTQVFTPQLVIDGRLQAVGSDRAGIRRALLDAAKAPRAAVSLSAARLEDGPLASVRISVRDVPPSMRTGTVRVAVAIVEDGLVTEVTRGENARRRLRHDAVARYLEPVAAIERGASGGEFTAEIPLDAEWSAGLLRAIAFLQDERTRHVLGAATAGIE